MASYNHGMQIKSIAAPLLVSFACAADTQDVHDKQLGIAQLPISLLSFVV
jgi:hypothetical protein